MSDFKIPDLPSDDELGITDKDREELRGDEAPELSAKEMAALLGEAPRPPQAPPKPLKGATAPPGGAPPKEPPKGKTASRPQEPSGPRSRWRGPGMLAALLTAAWLLSSYRMLPAPTPANAADTIFSSARAMAHLVEIARRPHPPGSPAHQQVRDYLLERFRGLGLEPEVQTTTALLERGSLSRAATVRNIVARIPGSGSTGTIVLTAHYDGREISRAAGDDGVGVVAILETARALKAGAPLLNDVLLVITDAEELGLLGARAFVDEHPAMADVTLVLSLEMRGGGGPSVMFETGPENGWVIRELAASGARPFANALSYEVYKRLPNDTDFTPFREAGRQGLNFAGIGRASVYHQSYDNPENVSEATLQHKGASVLQAVRHLGNRPLDQVTAPDVTFFTAPFVGLVSYDLGLVLPLAAILLMVAAALFLPARRAGSGGRGIAVGLLLGVASLAAAAAAGWGLMAWLPRFHPEFGSLHGSAFHGEGWYVAALVAFALAVVSAFLGIARRWFSATELSWGALLLPLGLMAYVALRYPAAAVNVQVPLGAALLSVAAAFIPVGGWVGALRWLLVAALALPVLALMVPLGEFMWLGLSFQAAPLVGALAALTLLLVLPALDQLREPNAWWGPVTALAVGALCLGVGIRAARPDAARPAPSTLAYVMDHGTGEALWITEGTDDPVDAPARAWAEASAGAPFTETRSLERYGFGRREPRVAMASPVAARRPELWTLSDSVVGETRHLRLAVRSAVGAELIQFRLSEESGTRITSVNGRPLAPGRRPTLVEHWGLPDPVVVLELEAPVGAVLEMDVVEHLLRPEELLGAEPFRRPPELAPDITWLSDRVVLRTPATSLEIMPGPPPELGGAEADTPGAVTPSG